MNEKHEDSWLWDRTGTPDDDVRRLEALLAPLGHDDATPLRIVAAPRRRVRGIAAAAALLVAVGAGVWMLARDRSAVVEPSHAPALRRGSEVLAETAWIDAAAGDVELALGDELGRITLEAGGRLQVRRLAPEVTRLYLDRGRIAASIAADARPRFFQVDTPAVRCVDLGCRYTLEVDAEGDAFVHVLTGQVAFESEGDEVYVPANATCRAFRGGRAGTPRFRDAPGELVTLLDAYDAAFDDGVQTRRRAAQHLCDRVTRIADTLSVWHLLRDPDPRIGELAEAALVRVAGPELEEVPTTREGWKRELAWWWY